MPIRKDTTLLSTGKIHPSQEKDLMRDAYSILYATLNEVQEKLKTYNFISSSGSTSTIEAQLLDLHLLEKVFEELKEDFDYYINMVKEWRHPNDFK